MTADARFLRGWQAALILVPLHLGCASSKAPPASPQEKQASSRTEREPAEPPSPHVAPPPAYGNKIVMMEPGLSSGDSEAETSRR